MLLLRGGGGGGGLLLLRGGWGGLGGLTAVSATRSLLLLSVGGVVVLGELTAVSATAAVSPTLAAGAGGSGTDSTLAAGGTVAMVDSLDGAGGSVVSPSTSSISSVRTWVAASLTGGGLLRRGLPPGRRKPLRAKRAARISVRVMPTAGSQRRRRLAVGRGVWGVAVGCPPAPLLPRSHAAE